MPCWVKYENLIKNRTIPITSRGTTDLDEIVDVKLQQFFEEAKDSSKVVDEKVSRKQVSLLLNTKKN